MSRSTKTKNDVAWEKLFEKYHILEDIDRDGRFDIRSSTINEFREARLMTKFDHRSNLPAIFKKNQLSILPITRGEYVIARFNAYEEIDSTDNHSIKYVEFPEHIQSINHENISSEATAINSAYVSGILPDFLEDEELLPTVSGRMNSGSFEFGIDSLSDNNPLWLRVTNSQIEIDGGYEGVSSLSLIEAKLSIASDFLVRQLYYPVRKWTEIVSKEVWPIFLIYSNGIFHLYQYQFEDKYHYNSIRLVKEQQYSFERKNISLDDIRGILASTTSVAEPEIPFPQADSFERVISLCEILFKENELSRDEVTTMYDFDVRQTNYYVDAGRYLGLNDKSKDDGVSYFLTSEGEALFKKDFRERQLGFAAAILQHPAFSQALELYLQKAELPSISEIVEIMRRSDLYHMNADSTYRRRASTVQSWISWILGLQD